MDEYLKKSIAKNGGRNQGDFPAQAKTNGIPNSALLSVLEGKSRATSEMVGHSRNVAPSIAAKMSRAFGMDLNGMQIYRSDAMAGTGMQGMAQGNKIVLSSDVDLNTTAGQAVLGHEISHVRAQSMGIGTGHGGLYENAALEHQADTEGLLAAQGRSIYADSAYENPGMSYGLGMQGVEGLTPLSGGLGAAAAAPMQASKDKDKAKAEGLEENTFSIGDDAPKKAAKKSKKELKAEKDAEEKETEYKRILEYYKHIKNSKKPEDKKMLPAMKKHFEKFIKDNGFENRPENAEVADNVDAGVMMSKNKNHSIIQEENTFNRLSGELVRLRNSTNPEDRQKLPEFQKNYLNWVERHNFKKRVKKEEFSHLFNSEKGKEELVSRWQSYTNGQVTNPFKKEREEAKLNNPQERTQEAIDIDEQLQAGTDMDQYEELKTTNPEEYERIRTEHIDKSMNNIQSRKFYESMTQSERLAMLEYTSSEYKDFHKYKHGEVQRLENELENLDPIADMEKVEDLRSQLPKTSKLDEKTAALDNALGRYETPYAFTVWRAIKEDRFKAMMGGVENYEDLVGKTITDSSYMSSATDKSVCTGWRDSNIVLEIDIPKGVHVGAPIGDMTSNGKTEHEFLFSGGTQLKVLEIKNPLDGTGENEGKKLMCIHCAAIDNHAKEEGKKK